jgi:hypothetical protein
MQGKEARQHQHRKWFLDPEVGRYGEGLELELCSIGGCFVAVAGNKDYQVASFIGASQLSPF